MLLKINQLLKSSNLFPLPRRKKFDFFGLINKYDSRRVSELGPDIACAEWLLANNASLKWLGIESIHHKGVPIPDNGLSKLLKISHIIANDSTINEKGLKYIESLKHLEYVKFNNCTEITDSFLKSLFKILENQLKVFKISNCFFITDDSLKKAAEMKKLELLEIRQMPSVKNLDEIKTYLESHLPKSCEIIVTEFSSRV